MNGRGFRLVADEADKCSKAADSMYISAVVSRVAKICNSIQGDERVVD
jgi:hypothetical protein